MKDFDILHFEQLKKEIQTLFLENNTPSHDDISRWKGIDIIYFQEDLRKKVKGNISEKSFYTYFKISPVAKLPRIDMLNLLSVYAGYQSWYEFKKQHLFQGEKVSEMEETLDDKREEEVVETQKLEDNSEINNFSKISEVNTLGSEDIQISSTDIQLNKENNTDQKNEDNLDKKNIFKGKRELLFGGISVALLLGGGLLGFKDQIFGRYFTYCFTDADRNAAIRGELEIKVIKKNESPLFYRIKPGECFYYSTKDPELKMEISSTLYENRTIDRKLESAPKEEIIELKPDDYKMALDYFSKKNFTGEDNLNKKREQLNRLISDDATIYQIYDSDVYGIESLSKQKYITLVTTPTTSLKNLKVIEMKRDKGKIVSIKFKISNDEKN